MTETSPALDQRHVPADLPSRIQHYIDGEFVDSVDGDTFDVLEPVSNEVYVTRRCRQEGRHRPRRRRSHPGIQGGPVAADAAARAISDPASHRRPRRAARCQAGRARILRLGSADHAGSRPGTPRSGELPVLRRPDRRAGRRHLQGSRPSDQLRQSQADRRRGAHHAVEHALHAGVVEARSRPGQRQHRRPEARRVHARCRHRCGPASSRRPACRRESSISSTVSARRPATRS